MNLKRNYNNLKSFIHVIVISTILIATIFLITLNVNKKDNIEITKQTVSFKEIGDDFIYYNGYIYYKNKNLSIINESDIGEQIGVVKYHLMYQDIKDNSFECYDDKSIYGYALNEGTPVYKHSQRTDVLLVHTEYNYHEYYIYTKEKTVSDYPNFNYYKNNKTDVHLKLISIGDIEIPIEIDLSKIQEDEDNLYMNPYMEGFIPFYLLIEDNGIYQKYEGKGNIFLNVIIFNIDEKQYIYSDDNLSIILKNLYLEDMNNNIE